MATTVSITTTAQAPQSACLDYRDAIKAARVTCPRPDVAGAPLRRYVAMACEADTKHARNDFWRIVVASGDAVRFDRFLDPDCHTPYQFSHETRAGTALVWLSHLQGHDAQRHGLWAVWSSMTQDGKRAWVRRRRYLLRGLLKAAAAYTAARNAI
jgi:hypothetical protein